MFQIEYSKSSIFECEYCMEMISVNSIKLGEEKVVSFISLKSIYLINE